LIGPIPRGTDLWQEKYNARTSVERAASSEKGIHHLADPRVRGLSKVKIHVYLALCAQILKRIGAAIAEGLINPHPMPHRSLENLNTKTVWAKSVGVVLPR
jgi:hypothetical protein